MTTTAPHITDRDIHDSVEAELRWLPQIDAPAIGVAVKNAIVTLTGEVASLSQRVAAKNAALRVHGVTAVADEIEVRSPSNPRTDTDTAEAVRNALEWNPSVPSGKVKAEVRDHVVTLTGTVPWDYQRQGAQKVVEHLLGVRRVDNQITLAAKPSAPDTAHRIKSAFVRSASIDADSIDVDVVGNTVVLTGHMSSWAEKEEATRAAWASPNVAAVTNNITVGPR